MAEMEIPCELITEILTRLPVKPLNPFKCVSKSWNSLISSPSFINHHLKSNPKPSPNIVVTSRQSLFSALIHDNPNNNLHFSELDHPFKINLTHLDADDVRVIGSCNGILLISDFGNKTTLLYNPANNTYRLLPAIQSRTKECFGFGYDNLTDDYKVIRLFQNSENPSLNLEICVYSMRNNVWKFIKDESALGQKYYLNHEYAVGANGVLFFRFVTIDYKPLLLCFDVRTEGFSIVDYPELECYPFYKVSMSLRVLRGCLCLIVNDHRKGDELLYADVWEMREAGKEASWVKLFRIQNSVLVGMVERCSYIALVADSKDKSKLLIEVDETGFDWYDLVTKRVKKVEIQGLREKYSPHHLQDYTTGYNYNISCFTNK